ncbi:MAG: hypothetical protein DESF_01984 [Desulfovibrio sp.]
MTPEEKILERLDAIEEKLTDLQAAKENSRMLIEQLTPIGNHAFRLAVEEMESLNGRVTLDDILDLVRKGLLTVPRITWLLDQLENATDLWHVLHPALGPTFPHIVEKMGKWEQDGVFAKASALKNAGGTMLDALSPEDIAKTGEGLTFAVGLLQRLADPGLQGKINSLMDLMSTIDTSNVRPTGIFGVAGALRSDEGRQVMGLLVELLKAGGRLSATQGKPG